MKVHAVKPETAARGDYREAKCGAHNRGTLRFTTVLGATTCAACRRVERAGR